MLVDEAKTPDDNDNLSNLVKSEEDRKALKDFATAALPAALSAAKFGSHVYSIGKVLGPLMENAETLLGNQKSLLRKSYPFIVKLKKLPPSMTNPRPLAKRLSKLNFLRKSTSC